MIHTYPTWFNGGGWLLFLTLVALGLAVTAWIRGAR